MIDGIKRIAEGVIESGKQCSVYTGEITSITPLIIKISDELSLSTQLVVTGRVQTMLNDGDLIVGNSVALLRYQGGQNFLVMDEMDATTPNDWDSMAVINLQNHMEDLIKHITPAERTLWNENADNVPLQNHIADDVRHIFDWERTAWNEAVSNIPLNNHIADNVKHVTGDERTAWAKNVVDLDTHIGDQIKHITEDERTAWNVHKNNVIIHVTNADKIKWNDHVADEVIHITDGERTGWNSKTDDTTANGHINNLTPHVTADDKTRLGNTVLSTVQTLTTGQKAQARANIGTLKIEDSNYAYEVIFNILTQTGFMILPIRQSYVLDISKFDPFKGTLIEEGKGYIYVPDELVEDYKLAWVEYASQIFGLTALTEIPFEMFNNNLLLTSYPYKPTLVKERAFVLSGIENIDLSECVEVEAGGFKYAKSLLLPNLDICTKVSQSSFENCPAMVGELILPKVEYIGHACFNLCSGLTSVDCHVITSMSTSTFKSCTNLTKFIIRSSTMLPLGDIYRFENTPIANGTGFIYVPDALYDAYLIATNWATYASQIKKISELNE